MQKYIKRWSIRDIWTLFKTEEKKEGKKQAQSKINKGYNIRDIRKLFEQEEKDYYKPNYLNLIIIKVSNFWSNNFIEYESNWDKNKNLLLNKYLNKIESYLRNIITDLQNSEAWKIQLTIAISFISLKDAEEECAIHSTSGNIKFTP